MFISLGFRTSSSHMPIVLVVLLTEPVIQRKVFGHTLDWNINYIFTVSYGLTYGFTFSICVYAPKLSLLTLMLLHEIKNYR